jgi:hypothetical protein
MELIALTCGEPECECSLRDREHYNHVITSFEELKQIIDSNYKTFFDVCHYFDFNTIEDQIKIWNDANKLLKTYDFYVGYNTNNIINSDYVMRYGLFEIGEESFADLKNATFLCHQEFRPRKLEADQIFPDEKCKTLKLHKFLKKAKKGAVLYFHKKFFTETEELMTKQGFVLHKMSKSVSEIAFFGRPNIVCVLDTPALTKAALLK